MHLTRSDELTYWHAFLDLCALTAPRAIASEPPHRWDWKAIVRLASEHLITPAVWPAIEGRDCVPSEVKAYFRVTHEMNAERNAAILNALAEALSLLHEIGIKPILLKGAASLASELYVDPAERILTDIDLLVSGGQIQAADAALCDIGYTRYTDSTRRWVRPNVAKTHHIQALIHPSGLFSIEIHRAVVVPEFERILPKGDMFKCAVAIPWNGRSVLVLHPTHRLIHNIVNSQLQDGRFHRGMIDLRQMRELALFVARHCNAVDWLEVEHRFSETGYADVLAEQAALCTRLMGVPLPVTAAQLTDSIDRLRRGLNYRPAAAEVLARLARNYSLGFLRDPWLAVNLLNPSWWPQRIRGVWRLVRGRRR